MRWLQVGATPHSLPVWHATIFYMSLLCMLLPALKTYNFLKRFPFALMSLIKFEGSRELCVCFGVCLRVFRCVCVCVDTPRIESLTN